SAFAKATADNLRCRRSEGWWSTGGKLPARRACKACLHPCSCPIALAKTGGGELRGRTSVLADPPVFETDCRALQRRSPCIPQGSNLEPVRYERTALPIELGMRARQTGKMNNENGAPAGNRNRLCRLQGGCIATMLQGLELKNTNGRRSRCASRNGGG